MKLSEIEKRLETLGIDWKSSFEALKMSISEMPHQQLKEFIEHLESEHENSKPM